MPAEAVMYKYDRPVLQDGLVADGELLGCSECDAVYRVHFSPGEVNMLPEYRFRAGEKINRQHPMHERAILLTLNPEDPLERGC
jgi:hypothetical protein